METQATKTPIHLWIVGGLATLWNAFGCFDYFMTRTKGAAYIESMMPTIDGAAMMAYINNFPIWAAIGWGLGVWAGLVGSILLLVRHRWAAAVLGLSLIGAVVGIGYQLANPVGIIEISQGVNGMMPYIIVVVALALFLYARAMQRKGVLR
ncbi:hypothetical protein [Sphingomonas sp.]|uniref:hypothetical protein n=1 Tax=Sphingomonas sp. TaxID=28214 RepID=UPI00286C3CB3|nr:hypothetical protein [Sphingomonas sp.]